MSLIALLMSWPGIIVFNLLAGIAAWQSAKHLMLIAAILSLPSAYYLFAASSYVSWIALLVPLLLIASVILIACNQLLLPKLLVIPVHAVYLCLAWVVLTQ